MSNRAAPLLSLRDTVHAFGRQLEQVDRALAAGPPTPETVAAARAVIKRLMGIVGDEEWTLRLRAKAEARAAKKKSYDNSDDDDSSEEDSRSASDSDSDSSSSSSSSSDSDDNEEKAK